MDSADVLRFKPTRKTQFPAYARAVNGLEPRKSGKSTPLRSDFATK
jgi:hypothetical protein